MTTFRVTIMAGRYPTDYDVQATNWATAAARAIRLWKKRFKGDRTNEIKIRMVKV